jgi:hypothetical protein
MELLTMMRIKQKVRHDLADRADLLLPVRFVAVSDLLGHERTARAFAEIRKRTHIGVQYDWLGRFCHQFGISDLQLCIHRDDRAHDVLQHVVEDRGGTLKDYRVSDRHVGSAEHELFRHYSFPIFDMSKLQMEAIAKDEGFSAIMALTWFCHAPKGDKPCGLCRPCRYTIDEGLGWRVPYFRRLKGRMFWNARELARATSKAIPLLRTR